MAVAAQSAELEDARTTGLTGGSAGGQPSVNYGLFDEAELKTLWLPITAWGWRSAYK